MSWLIGLGRHAHHDRALLSKHTEHNAQAQRAEEYAASLDKVETSPAKVGDECAESVVSAVSAGADSVEGESPKPRKRGRPRKTA